VSLTINLSVKIQFRIFSYKSSLQTRINCCECKML